MVDEASTVEEEEVEEVEVEALPGTGVGGAINVNSRVAVFVWAARVERNSFHSEGVRTRKRGGASSFVSLSYNVRSATTPSLWGVQKVCKGQSSQTIW